MRAGGRVIGRVASADGGYFLEGRDGRFADMLCPFVEVVVVFIQASKVVVAGVVGEGGGGEAVALGIVVEKEELVPVTVEPGQGGFDVLGGVGYMKIWQAVGAVLEEGREGEHVEIALEDGDVFGAVLDGARAFGVGAEFEFPVAQFPAAGVGDEADCVVLFVAAGEVIMDFPVVLACHLEGDPPVEKIVDQGGGFDAPDVVDLYLFFLQAGFGEALMWHIFLLFPGAVEFTQDVVDRHAVVADDKVDEGTAFLEAMVVPDVEVAVDFEGWFLFLGLFERGIVPMLMAVLLFGLDADGRQVVYHVELVDVVESHNASFLFFTAVNVKACRGPDNTCNHSE